MTSILHTLRYTLARLGLDYFLSGIDQRIRRQRPLPPPRSVVWDCTRRCMLHCVHCGATEETYAHELTAEQVTDLIDELAALNVRMLSATGGEPLLRRDLLHVLEYAHHKGLQTGIATNAFLIDEGMARRIHRAGVDSIQISLDGLARTHNAIRRHERSFARATQAIRLLHAAGVPLLSVATTVTPHNLHELEALHTLLAQLGVRMWRLSVVMPIGRARAGDLLLDGAQLAHVLRFVEQHSRRGMHVYVAETLPHLGKWERRVRREPMVCPIGFLACCVGVDGHVRGCPEQPDTEENREGSVLDRSFNDIWQRGFDRYRNRELLATDADCAACELWNGCYGGCWVMREAGQHCIRKLIAALTTDE